MDALLAAVLVASALATQPLTVDVTRDRDVLVVDFALVEELPEAFESSLPSGAVVRVIYQVQIKTKRKFFWDRRLFRGRVISSVLFDPVTGRYRSELSLDEVIVASADFGDVARAKRWLVNPPPVRFSLEDNPKKAESFRIRMRAVFSSSTKWLVFPSVVGTEWVVVGLEGPSEGEPADAEAGEAKADGSIDG